MKKAVAKQWAQVLRSGVYMQGHNRLKTIPYAGSGEKFCCLGVLSDISLCGRWETEEGNIEAFYRVGDAKRDSRLVSGLKGTPLAVQAWAGLQNASGGHVMASGSRISLADMNDEGKTFEEIADYIEKNWESVVKKYTTEYFLKKFRAIPADKWLKGMIGVNKPGAAHCALGHCGVREDKVSGDWTRTRESTALAKVLTGGKVNTKDNDAVYSAVWKVNDAGNDPRGNMIRALEAIAAQEKQ